MPRSPLRPRRALAVATLGAALLVGLVATPVVAADDLRMTARPLLDGSSRAGAWVAVEVLLSNDGPPVVGELRLAGGTSGQTRFSVPVDLPTQSSKRYVIHAQSPAAGSRLSVVLSSEGRTLFEQPIEVSIHDPAQLVVGIVAERPQRLAGTIELLQSATGVGTGVISLEPADLPERPEAWSALDRIVWQDVDADLLSTDQRAALATWVASGGRLVVVAGANGADPVLGLPAELLPFEPLSTIDAPPDALTGLVGAAPDGAGDLPALAGELIRGRSLAVVGDRTIAAEVAIGAGAVTLLGFDPTTGWLAEEDGADTLWRRVLPPRGGAMVSPMTDDSQLLQAVSQLPSVALPPIGVLILLLGAYIVLVGPVTYLVLRRLDRREWAWVTVPALIVGFTVGAYAFGATLRGSDVIVNEVAIVRGSPETGRGAGFVYVGVLSPSRTTYQLMIPGGALLSAPISGDFFGGNAGATTLDIVQGDPAYVRDLAVGYGSMRTVRAEVPLVVPTLEADLRLDGSTLSGTVRNTSDIALDQPALVIGGNVAVLERLEPGATATVSLQLVSQQPWPTLSEKILGQLGFEASTDSQIRGSVRRSLIDQLTYDPQFGFSGTLPADGPVLLAFSDAAPLAADVAGHVPQRTATVLYHLPLGLETSGAVAYAGDMVRASVVSVDAPFFSKDPMTVNFGQGSLTMAYRPIGMSGSIEATGLVLTMNSSGVDVPQPEPIEPTGPAASPEPCLQQPCEGLSDDFLPETEILDLETSTWMALPHLEGGRSYAVADPARYVDATSGTVWVRFQNERPDGVGFQFSVRIEGTVE